MSRSTTSSRSNTSTLSKKRRLLDHLAANNTITAAQASRRFGVANIRATMSDIRQQVEAYGNWRIVTGTNERGETVYAMRRVVLVEPTFMLD